MFQERDYLLHSGEQVIDFSMQDERNCVSPYESHFVSRKDYEGRSLTKIGLALSLVHSREALIDKMRPDLMHCHNVYHQITPSIISVAKSRGIPVVLTLHNFKPVCPVYLRLRAGRPCSLCLDGDFHQVLMNRCAGGSIADSALLYAEAAIQRWLGSYEKVDRFLAPSRLVRDSALHRFRSEQVVLLYNGVDTAEIEVSTRDEGYVLHLGRLSRVKSVETLLRAHEAAGAGYIVSVSLRGVRTGAGTLGLGLVAHLPSAVAAPDATQPWADEPARIGGAVPVGVSLPRELGPDPVHARALPGPSGAPRRIQMISSCALPYSIIQTPRQAS